MPRHNVPFDPVNVADDTIRKTVFRDEARAISSNQFCYDVPGAIAALMERAFKAGIEVANAPCARIEARHREDFGPLDLADIPRRAFEDVRLALGCATAADGNIVVREDLIHREAFVLFMQPPDPKVPHAPVRDEWFVGRPLSNARFPNKGALPLIEAGLYERPQAMENRWKVTFLTEWGFEYAMTGATRRPALRVEGTSTTFSIYRRYFACGRAELLRSAAEKSGLLDKPRKMPLAPPLTKLTLRKPAPEACRLADGYGR